MRAMIVREPNQPLTLDERPTPEPGPGEARVRVHACGICHSDLFVTEGHWPGLSFPWIPGHEVAGVIDAVGDGVSHVAVGDRVGLGWHGGHDGTCDACLAGKFVHCQNQKITGISLLGGYADYVVAPAVALARMPEGMGFVDAGPLLCAGVTTFNALRNSGARSGDLVGIQGLGGLGHLGVQFARAMGFEVVAISRGSDKEGFARELGAHHYVDAKAGDVGEAVQALGGARVILATAPYADAISQLVPALGLDGCLLVVAAAFEPLSVGAVDLISADRRVQGWSSGTAIDSIDTMRFAKLHGIRPMVETFPLEKANEALAAMKEGSVRFRAVLDVAGAD
ncbi:MAG: alcohol dehydrogenase catalytic domain-containing protein [Acidobacteria bacterium]|nr:alcohol dehydrogenase catalytic domain-containing protein [Acidobacteriota bacterium]